MLIAVSRGVEKDLLDYALQVPPKIRAIYDPVIGDFESLQQEKVDHPFFEDPNLKIVLGTGYLISSPTKFIRILSETVSRRFRKYFVIPGFGLLNPRELLAILKETSFKTAKTLFFLCFYRVSAYNNSYLYKRSRTADRPC